MRVATSIICFSNWWMRCHWLGRPRPRPTGISWSAENFLEMANFVSDVELPQTKVAAKFMEELVVNVGEYPFQQPAKDLQESLPGYLSLPHVIIWTLKEIQSNPELCLKKFLVVLHKALFVAVGSGLTWIDGLTQKDVLAQNLMMLPLELPTGVLISSCHLVTSVVGFAGLAWNLRNSTFNWSVNFSKLQRFRNFHYVSSHTMNQRISKVYLKRQHSSWSASAHSSVSSRAFQTGYLERWLMC